MLNGTIQPESDTSGRLPMKELPKKSCVFGQFAACAHCAAVGRLVASPDDLPAGVYLTSEIDGMFIYMLKQIESILNASLLMMATPSLVQVQGETQFFYPAVRSSNNNFSANYLSDVYIQYPRFYWDPDLDSWSPL